MTRATLSRISNEKNDQGKIVVQGIRIEGSKGEEHSSNI